MEDDRGMANGSVVVTPAAAAKEGERERRATVSLSVCKDNVRGRCSRADCKFAHPMPNQTTHVSDEGKEMVTVCNDSLRGRCIRGINCRFFHPPPHLAVTLASQVGITLPASLTAAAANPAAAAAAALAGGPAGATALTDAYYSPLMAAPPLLGGAAGAGPPRAFTRPSLEVCRDFVKGKCSREAAECKFAHATPSSGDGNLVTVCQDFLKGRCERPTCRYFHPDAHLRPRIHDIAVARPGAPGGAALGLGAGALLDPSDPLGLAAYYQAAYSASLYGDPSQGLAQLQQPSSKRMRGGADGDGVLGGMGLDYGGEDDRFSSRKSNLDVPVSYYTAGGLSQAYLNAAAAAAAAASLPHAGALNPYMHSALLPAGAMGAQGGSSRGGGGGDRLPVCRDFVNNKCSRPNCRYVHPEGNVQVVDNQVTVCRDSIRGRCERPSCRFYHPKSSTSDGAPASRDE